MNPLSVGPKVSARTEGIRSGSWSEQANTQSTGGILKPARDFESPASTSAKQLLLGLRRLRLLGLRLAFGNFFPFVGDRHLRSEAFVVGVFDDLADVYFLH